MYLPLGNGGLDWANIFEEANEESFINYMYESTQSGHVCGSLFKLLDDLFFFINLFTCSFIYVTTPDKNYALCNEN